MPRPVLAHHVPGVPEPVLVTAEDEPGPDGACCVYRLSDGRRTPEGAYPLAARGGPPDPVDDLLIPFQAGPVGETGRNGVSGEALAAAIADRLEGWQRGPFACAWNAIGLWALRVYLWAMACRTEDRIRRGVEGFNKP